MSGGVDSSVAAALLVEEGYEVIGMMMRLWSEPGSGPATPSNRCCTPGQMVDAHRVADHLGIPLYVIDMRDHFRRSIVQFFIDEHDAGRTPNPCVECNRQIRFTYLLERALAMDADYLATGHYARIDSGPHGFRLRQGVDTNKDQSYVLHTFRQDQLARVLFPIGEMTKEEVRRIAHERGLTVATKQESQDLCFLKDGDYRRFIRDNSLQVHQPGPILDQDDNQVGRHEGLPFYTIGQRKGLGIAAAEPLFVVRKDLARNALIVGHRADLGVSELTAGGVNWIAGAPPPNPIETEVKIRYKATPIKAMVYPLPDDRMRVLFDQPAIGVTPGQAAVIYDGDICLGGGIILDEVRGERNNDVIPEVEELTG